jgi:hypothetical protein
MLVISEYTNKLASILLWDKHKLLKKTSVMKEYNLEFQELTLMACSDWLVLLHIRRMVLIFGLLLITCNEHVLYVFSLSTLRSNTYSNAIRTGFQPNTLKNIKFSKYYEGRGAVQEVREMTKKNMQPEGGYNTKGEVKT